MEGISLIQHTNVFSKCRIIINGFTSVTPLTDVGEVVLIPRIPNHLPELLGIEQVLQNGHCHNSSIRIDAHARFGIN